MTVKTLEPCPELLEKLEQLQQDLERETTYKDFWQEQAEAVGKRYAELVKKCKEELENKPLTLDQIKDMVGEPVWIQRQSGEGEYKIIKNVKEQGINFTDKFILTIFDIDNQGGFKLYRSKPEGVNHE